MKDSALFMFIIAFLLVGCSSSGLQNKEKISNTNVDSSYSSKVLTPSSKGIIVVNMENGKQQMKIRKEKDQIIYLQFKSLKDKKLTAQLIPQSEDTNIRFAQLNFPDGRLGGRFSKTLIYTLPVDGQYKVSIHEDLMHGNEWSGEFIVELNLD